MEISTERESAIHVLSTVRVFLNQISHLVFQVVFTTPEPNPRSLSPTPTLLLPESLPVAREALEESSHNHDHGFDVETDPYPLLPPNRPVLRDAARHLPSTHQSMCTATSQSHKMTMQPASAPSTFIRPRRKFHNYFITHLPSSSMHPDRRSMAGSFGDPQIFYFAVFDGHGGGECSEFLRDELHGYIEEASSELGLRSSLGKKHRPGMPSANGEKRDAPKPSSSSEQVKMATAEEVKKEMQGNVPTVDANDVITEPEHKAAVHGADPVPARVRDFKSAIHHLVDLIKEYRDTVGGYFRRFQPEHFNLNDDIPEITVESVLEYAFLRADLDFISAQARKPDPTI
ncbi:unnamed protein product [Parascedosporium putredinis]|uniref:PPM-type phosphatase domain-containing protein n=1 Tax=Parascedosporium putredinis TaxID=1442378 RepID=A0A9P1GX68_9PEZI|nr:unnamed protein product [Parascedosporium putredinis]CAI7988755.1 unnamed protein product [Parascedosporium putredinis]